MMAVFKNFLGLGWLVTGVFPSSMEYPVSHIATSRLAPNTLATN